MPKSRGIVRGIFEEDGNLLVSFFNHDGYFHVRVTHEDVCARIRESHNSKEEIAFTFDRDLRIVSIAVD